MSDSEFIETTSSNSYSGSSILEDIQAAADLIRNQPIKVLKGFKVNRAGLEMIKKVGIKEPVTGISINRFQGYPVTLDPLQLAPIVPVYTDTGEDDE